MKNLLILFCIISVVLLSVGCSSENSIYHVELIKPERVDTLKISEINLYLESSVSMKGYVNVNTSGNYPLKEIVPFLITDLDNTYNLNSNLYTYSDEARKYPFSKSEFYKQLRSGGILGGKSSRLQNIFGEIINNTEGGTINILITDCIVDLGDYEAFSEGGLVTEAIYRELLKKENMGIGVFKYLSDFNGTYYFDRNNTGGRYEKSRPFFNTTLHKRPLYVWVFGQNSLVKDLLAKNIVRDFESAHFYNLQLDAEKLGLLKEPKSGKIAINTTKQEILIKEVSESKPVKFTIGVKVKNESKILHDLILDPNNYKIEPDFVQSFNIEAFDESLLLGKIENKSALEKEGYNYYIQPVLGDFDTGIENITIRLLNNQPAWVANTNLSDDLEISAEDLENKTFSFQYIVDAFDKRFPEEDLLEIKMTKN